ncbi:MAG: D-alanyl-D-alanine carboxypeptidase family protein [Gammaproteobacteria bacterium]|nr:D-alanyl-D-alanine carboxypeptidase family protein [Gammaproteobacteria bacterium]
MGAFKSRLHVLAMVGALCIFLAQSAAGAAVVPAPPEIDSRAYLLQDFHSGRVLSEANADERMEPASLTKMMTVYVVFAELEKGKFALGDPVRVSKKAWQMGGSKMFIEVDKEVPVEALLKGVIIQSGNDASVALAEFVAGDESAFADLMNQYAERLGMTGTHFVNSSGLPHEEHYTTARDMATMARALIRDFPDHYAWHAIREYEWNGIKQPNRNRLLWRDESVDGIKTGHTESAGYCLVASAKRDDMRLVSVVMGSESEEARARETGALLQFGFRFYETHRLYGAEEPVTRVRVWQGERRELALGLEHDLYITVARGSYESLDASMRLDSPIKAPVDAGARQGMVQVKLDDDSVVERPLVALESVPLGSLWQRLSDSVRLMLE